MCWRAWRRASRYRAVRTRGTIGGSLCHADPAADWATVLTALSAEVLTSEDRRLALRGFILGAFRTPLNPGELLRAVRIPKAVAGCALWGYVKACRKPGEFAHAMAAVLVDRGVTRAVIGATGGAPIVLEGDAVTRADLPGLDAVDAQMQRVVLARAMAQAGLA